MTRLLFFLLTLLFSVSADPSGFGGGLNFYAYANANPVSYLDPFGLGALESGTGGSWLNQALEGTAMGDWSKGFSSGLGSYVSGENLNRYTPTGSQAYQSGVASGYGAVPNAMELANVALTMSAVGAAVSAETVVAESAASQTAAAAGGLATGADEAVFWSGIGRGGAERAATWAGQNGGATLESTLASRGTTLPVWDASNPASVAAWRQASTDFAAGARGNVRVLQGDSLRVDAIWRDEFRALQANPNVNSIRAINPNSGAEVLLWP